MENFNFNRDFYEGCKSLGEKDAAALAWALLAYGYEGVEPNLKPALKAAFSFARGRVDAMVKGSQGGKKRTRSASAGKAHSHGASQGGSQDPRQDPSQGGSQDPRQQKEKEKEKENKHTSVCLPESAAPSATHCGEDEGFEAPSLEAVRAYFGANCLLGDPEAFWSHYASQGWEKGNGCRVSDWRALALSWARRQRRMDAEDRARGKPTQGEVAEAAWKPVEDPVAKAMAEVAKAEAEYERLYGEIPR